MIKIRLWLLWPLILVIVGCVMANKVYDYIGDPFNSDSVDVGSLVHVQSSTSDFDTIVAPSAHNWPEKGSSTRTFVELPMLVYQVDLVTYPCTITGSVTGALSRVGASPAAGEYRLADIKSVRGHVIEINSAQWGETISYDYYGTGTVHNNNSSNNAHEFNCDTITIGSTTCTGGKKVAYRDETGTETTDTYKEKILAIPAWNMEFSSAGSQSLNIAHGGIDQTKVISIEAMIEGDSGGSRVNFLSAGSTLQAGYIQIDGTNVQLNQNNTSRFNNAAYNDGTKTVRGHIIIKYLN